MKIFTNEEIHQPEIIETENGAIDVDFNCTRFDTRPSLNWCENNCPHYFSCDIVLIVNDILTNMGY